MTERSRFIMNITIALLALIVSIVAIVISERNGKQAVTDVAIESFDSKWNSGTFTCVKLLLSLSPKTKLDVYSGKAFELPSNLKNQLVTCKPEYESEIGISKLSGNLEVPAKITYAIKEKIQKSFNALDLLISKMERIHKCEAWVSIENILERKETRSLITEWQKYGSCGTSCFQIIEKFIDKGGTQKMSANCD